jgi:acyl dehydratase
VTAFPVLGTVLDDEVVGRTYAIDGVVVDPVAAEAYAAVAGDDPARYGTSSTHPCFVINPAMKVLEELLADPALGVRREDMLHAQSDMVFAHAIAPGEVVDLRAVILDAGEYGARQAYVIETTVHDRSGRLLVALETILAFASPIPGAAGRPPVFAPPPLRANKPPVIEVERLLDADLPRRYAAASGDHNPIHLDDAAARAAGLPGVILHGMSTMAIGATLAVDGLCGGDPGRLRRMRVRFSKPTAPGCRVTYRFHATDTPRLFAVTAHADGRAIWKQSVVELSN